MLIKRGDAEIINVIDDKDHELDDAGTRKAMKRAAKEVKEAEKQEAEKQEVEPTHAELN